MRCVFETLGPCGLHFGVCSECHALGIDRCTERGQPSFTQHHPFQAVSIPHARQSPVPGLFSTTACKREVVPKQESMLKESLLYAFGAIPNLVDALLPGYSFENVHSCLFLTI